jgi:hypothetical protein
VIVYNVFKDGGECYECGGGEEFLGVAADKVAALAIVEEHANKHVSCALGVVDYLTINDHAGFEFTVEHRRASAGQRGPLDFHEETYYIREWEVLGAVG